MSGSPKQNQRGKKHIICRNTSTHVEKTTQPEFLLLLLWKHLHARGENFVRRKNGIVMKVFYHAKKSLARCQLQG
jgi:hypothetical protein